MPRKRGRKAERGPVGKPTSIKIPMSIKGALAEAAAEQRRSVHWLVCEILCQWEAYYRKKKK